jgi:hypothetical protein
MTWSVLTIFFRRKGTKPILQVTVCDTAQVSVKVEISNESLALALIDPYSNLY